MMQRVALATTLAAMMMTGAGYADGGAIPFIGSVRIFEPTQRAMIAWNGEEEIMVLSTDLRASQPTKVLEVFPFLAEPDVKEADIQIFVKANILILRKLSTASLGNAGAGKSTPPARVTFHEQIGAHDISVIQALRMDGFVEWVNTYLRSQGVQTVRIPPRLASSIDEYIREGYSWFAFDVVSLGKGPVTKQALRFRFKSSHLFYPLRIARAQAGETTISLHILTKELVNLQTDLTYGIGRDRLRLAHTPVSITADELRDLNAEMARLFDPSPEVILRVWDIKGALSGFDQDLIVRRPPLQMQQGPAGSFSPVR